MRAVSIFTASELGLDGCRIEPMTLHCVMTQTNSMICVLHEILKIAYVRMDACVYVCVCIYLHIANFSLSFMCTEEHPVRIPQ